MLHYIGCDDTTIELFENQYPVPEGMAYNSYVIEDEKIAVLDTVDARCAEQWRQNLNDVLGSRTPDYLVIHHLEPDHSALAFELLQRFPSMRLVATQKALQMFAQFFPKADIEGRTLAVKDGDTLPLGVHTLRFFTAPMVHWPEVMVSFDESDKLLFSADAFGKFGSLSVCGSTDADDTDWACEARRYYFNICGKYGGPVQTLLRKVATLDVKTICPLHGPRLTATIKECVSLYNTWSSYEAEKKGVLVAYASIHGGTKIVAEYLGSIFEERGLEVSLIDLTNTDVSYAVEDAFMFDRVVFAASSYDAGLFPPMHNLLHHLAIKAFQNKRVAIVENGSWAPSAGRVMREMLQAMKNIKIVEPAVTIRSRMTGNDKQALSQLADVLSEEQ
ncbi:MAG: FprA family A-type flavoprotein [Paludibacteraceae bacterium]|nr:FprA family A-type flavoprotein [Paludibacteraceae bacterium]